MAGTGRSTYLHPRFLIIMILNRLQHRARASAAAALLSALLTAFVAAPAHAQWTIQLSKIGGYTHGPFNTGAAEISAFDRFTKRLFVTNANATTLDILDLSNPANPALFTSIDLSPYGGGIQSVAVSGGLVGVAVQATPRTNPGSVVFLNTSGAFLSQVTVGALPDMVVFTPNGKYLLVANEGEPNDTYTVDPEGSISVIHVGGRNITQSDVRTADFRAFNPGNIDSRIRIFGPSATVPQDLEPEYIAVDHDSRTAYVTLQENNAIAVVDIRTATVTRLFALGTKDHNLAGNGLDPSDRDNGSGGPAIRIGSWPIFGMYQPDGIAAYDYRDHTYLVTANEGDARSYSGYDEEVRVGSGSYVLDPTRFPAATATILKNNANLGRLTVTRATGNSDGDGDYDSIHVFGARSFSIWTDYGMLVFDSGDDFEQITALASPAGFNSGNDANGSFDTRSDNKGPEPEGVALGKINGRLYAFVGLERIGGIMVYDVTNPFSPAFIQYINTRNFGGNPAAGNAGDLGPEGLVFVDKSSSPNHQFLLIVTNEISGTSAVYQIDPVNLQKGVPGVIDDEPGIGQVTPNPAASVVHIPVVLNVENDVRLIVSTIDGTNVMDQYAGRLPCGQNVLSLDVSALTSGRYFVRVVIDGSVSEIRPLVVAR